MFTTTDILDEIARQVNELKSRPPTFADADGKIYDVETAYKKGRLLCLLELQIWIYDQKEARRA